MSYHLDTNAVVDVLRDRPRRVRERLRAVEQEPVAISSVVLYELRYGAARSRWKAENAERLDIFLARNIEVLPFEGEDASVAGEVRAVLEADGRGIGPYDVLIAAQALRAGATLVTANTREFRRVKGLKCVNWR